jgi:hypothetical protein
MTRWLLLLVLLVPLRILWAQTDATATPQIVRSIFDYDTCAPPCWLDLIPGQSTPADVQASFQKHSDIIPPQSIHIGPAATQTGEDIDPETGYMRNGQYSFDVGEPIEMQPGVATIRSRIDVYESKVDLIVIVPQEPILLAQVLDRLGTPDVIQLHFGIVGLAWFVLIYEEPHLRVNITQPHLQGDFTQPTQDCDLTTLPEHMMLDSIL